MSIFGILQMLLYVDAENLTQLPLDLLFVPMSWSSPVTSLQCVLVLLVVRGASRNPMLGGLEQLETVSEWSMRLESL